MKLKLFASILFALFLSLSVDAQRACGHQHLQSTLSGPSINNNAKSDTIDILNYFLVLDFYEIASGQMQGLARIRLRPKMPAVRKINLDLQGLQVDTVFILGKNLSYSHNDTLLRIQLQQAMALGDTLDLYVEYGGSPQMDPSGWGGFHRQNGYFFNLGVGFGSDPHTFGRAWFPCFDNFVERSTYDFQVLTKAPNIAVTNGLNVQNFLVQDSLKTVYSLRDPIPTYLASVAISTYATVRDTVQLQNATVPIELWARAADTANMKASFRNLKGVTRSFEKHFGPYRWERIGYAATTVGAMEHATSIHYPISAINGNLSSEDLMAHELAHHWWGNLITCESDADMWINEGMAEFSSHLYVLDVYGRSNYIDVVQANAYNVLRLAHQRDGAYLPLYGLDHGDVYGYQIYQKGAMVGHNLRSYMGEQLFDSSAAQLMQQNAFSNLNTNEVRTELERISGLSLSDFFDGWIYQPGFPQFSVDYFNADSIQLSQGLYQAPNFFDNSLVDVTFFASNGDTTSRCFSLGDSIGRFPLNLPFTPVFALPSYAGKTLAATTTRRGTFSRTGFEVWPEVDSRIQVQSVQDSVHIILQKHWAQPRSAFPHSARISRDRYWSLQAFNSANSQFSLRFAYNKNDLLSDDELLQQGEDSLILLFRPSGNQAWQYAQGQQKNTGASTSDGQGFIDLANAQPGEYVLANAGANFGLAEPREQSFKLFPNPAVDELRIELAEEVKTPVELRVYSINGEEIYRHLLLEHKSSISLDDIRPQTLLVKIGEEAQTLVLQP